MNTETALAKDRADWLLDAVACATQDRRFLRGDPAYDEVVGQAILLNGEKAILTALHAQQEAAKPEPSADDTLALLRDKARLDYLQRESHDLRCFPVPTGGDDADIGWRVVGHWMAEPQERTIAEVYHDNPRDAVDAAMNLTVDELREISHPTQLNTALAKQEPRDDD